MATRQVTGVLRRATGAAWAGADVTFQLVRGSQAGGVVYPPDAVTVTTDANGAFTATLWCTSEGQIPTKYECRLPGGYTFRFGLSYGTDPIALTELRAAGAPKED